MRFLFRTPIALALLLSASTPGAAQIDRWIAEGWRTDFSRVAVDLSEILNVIRRDGIPAISDPTFVAVNLDVGLAEREPVIGVTINGDARAYPLRIMMWHEIANDTIGGVPVNVTYCPLCNTAIVFDRTVEGTVLEFGVTGKLRFSDLIMYDRQTDSWWQQFTGCGIAGTYAETQLALIPSRLMSWGEFRAECPDGQVMVPSNARMRDYWRNPYVGYDTATAPFLFDGPPPTGMAAVGRVVLVRGEALMAFTLALIEERGEIVENGVTIRWNPGQATALGAAVIADAREVGGVEVFRVEGGAEIPVVHDVTFAFVVNTFEPFLPIRTE